MARLRFVRRLVAVLIGPVGIPVAFATAAVAAVAMQAVDAAPQPAPRPCFRLRPRRPPPGRPRPDAVQRRLLRLGVTATEHATSRGEALGLQRLPLRSCPRDERAEVGLREGRVVGGDRVERHPERELPGDPEG